MTRGKRIEINPIDDTMDSNLDIENICKAIDISACSIGVVSSHGEDTIAVKDDYMDAYLTAYVISDLLKRGYITIQINENKRDKYLISKLDYLQRLCESVKDLSMEEEE